MSNGMFCRYYARGICRFGDLCRFQHISPTQRNEHINNSHNTKNNSIGNDDDELNGGAVCLETLIKPDDPTSWVMAPVFIPKIQQQQQNDNNDIQKNDCDNINYENMSSYDNDDQQIDEHKSYADVVMLGACGSSSSTSQQDHQQNKNIQLCPFDMEICHMGELCSFRHSYDLCDMCNCYCLPPNNKDYRKQHIAGCIKQHEENMELAFAIQRSKDKTCGICFDVIMEKSDPPRRFGILPNCNHCYCLQCIRKWRQAKQFDNKITRSCPECRTSSDYVCPSAYWVDTKEEKDKLINDYKKALGETHCKYYKKGQGKCPFGNKCFYKHALPNGSLVDVGVPQRNVRKIHRANEEILDLFDMYLWNFVDRREYQWLDILSNLSDSDETDWSDELE